MSKQSKPSIVFATFAGDLPEQEQKSSGQRTPPRRRTFREAYGRDHFRDRRQPRPDAFPTGFVLDVIRKAAKAVQSA